MDWNNFPKTTTELFRLVKCYKFTQIDEVKSKVRHVLPGIEVVVSGWIIETVRSKFDCVQI